MASETASSEKLLFALQRAMNGTVGKRNPPPFVLDDARQAALEAVAALTGSDGKLSPRAYDALNDGLPADLRAWLLELPSFLAKKGRKEHGEELCGRYAALFGAAYLDAERAVVTWESGAKEAGRAALEAARAAHPDHCWPELRSGYVEEQGGYLDAAQKHFEAAVEKARKGDDKKDLRFSWDGLVQFWHNKGDRNKAVSLSRDMLKECPELEEELRVETIRAAPKAGRNDPCTCGSGKKWKKCCGAK
jgi:hypothetical protein